MGGKSSSSSSSSNSTSMEDNRIGATDSAVVLAGGSTLTLTDPGAFDFGEAAISANERIVMQLLGGLGSLAAMSLETVGKNADKAFEFVEQSNTDDEEKTFRSAVPWLMVGASVLAISYAISKR